MHDTVFDTINTVDVYGINKNAGNNQSHQDREFKKTGWSIPVHPEFIPVS